MKNIVIILALISLSFTGRSYTWQSFCPDTIYATNIYFGVGSSKGVICSPDGMYLWEEDIEEWTFYTYGGLPVTGAANFNETKILVCMGNGTWSDGIYTFDLATHQFEVVEWVVNPNFMLIVPVLDEHTNLFTDEYYVGSQFGGLYKSVDCINWTEVPYFNGKSCAAMDFYGEHLVVSEASNDYNIYCSDDYGVNWFEAASATLITDLKFNNSGILYGIFPDYSNSSGLYKSEDFGNNWEVEFWSDNMSAVGYDAVGNIFVGWKSSTIGFEGIAKYNPEEPPPGLSFMNQGLASTNINKILLNPVLSAIVIFCCTDAGVYMCNDYMVGIPDHTIDKAMVSINPNPVVEKATITLIADTEMKIQVEISVLDNQGIKVGEIIARTNSTGQLQIHWNKGDLPAGVYYLVVRSGNATSTKKFIIL